MSYSNFAIVILNWNGQKLLEQFLPSVIANSNDAKLYIIDNASTDNSIGWLNENYPTIHQINLTENLGYAGGYQKGLTEIDAEFYCLLNSDIEVTTDWLQPIQQLFKNDTNIAAIQPKIIDFKKQTHFEYAGAAGGLMDKFGYPYCRGRVFDSIEKDNGQYNDEVSIFWASGACFFIRKNDYWNVGGLDADYFAHQEEIDLCWRLHNYGKTVYYSGKSTVKHVGGASLGYGNPRKTFLNFRNSLFSILKNHKGISVVWILFIRMVLDGLAGVQFLFKGEIKHLIAVLKSHFSFYSNIPSLLKKRFKTAKRKRVYNTKSIVFDYFVLNKNL